MSTNGWEDPNDGGGVAALRKAHKKQAEEIRQLKEALAGTMDRERKFNINDSLASRGLDPRVAKFYPESLGTDDESVNKWVEENHELFGYRNVLDEQGAANVTSLTDAEVRGYQLQQDIAAYDRAVQMDLETRLKTAESAEEVMSILKTYAPPSM